LMKIISNCSTKESKNFTTAVVKWHQSLTTLLCALSCICYSRKKEELCLHICSPLSCLVYRQLKIVCGLMNELRFSFIFLFLLFFVHKSECALFTTRELFLMRNGNAERRRRSNVR
jgi:hypothetical protein